MANQQLTEYIKQQMQLGVPKESIKQTLVTSGWPESDITEAFGTLAGPAQPVQPAAPAVQPAQPVTSDIKPSTVSVAAKKPETTSFQNKVDSYVSNDYKAVVSASGGGKKFLLPAIMGTVILILLGATIYLYIQNSTLNGDISKRSLSNNDLSVQLAAAVQEKTNASNDIAKLREEAGDANSHLSALLPPVAGSSTAPVSVTLVGTLRGDEKAGYTLTTARGLVMALKNGKAANVSPILKPFVNQSATVAGTTVPGSREFVVQTVNGNPIPADAPPAQATTTTSTVSSTTKPIMP